MAAEDSWAMWCWVGDNDAGNEIEVKDGCFENGRIVPLASVAPGRMDRDWLLAQIRQQALLSGKKISLVRFRFEAIEVTVTPTGKIVRR